MKAWRKCSLENVYCYGSHNIQARISYNLCREGAFNPKYIYKHPVKIVRHRIAKKIARYGL